MINSVIKGSGRYIPEKVIDNSYFLGYEFYDENGVRIEKPGEEIIKKFQEITEIEERRYVDDQYLNSDIATFAAQKAIEDAQIDKETIDYIIVAQNFGDIDPVSRQIDMMPSMSSKVKHNLGIKNLKCRPYDMIFGCPGWVEGIILGHQLIQGGNAKNVLVIGSDTLSRAVDPHDRTAMIFADGSGAVVLSREEADEKYGVIAYNTLSYTGEELHYLVNGPSLKSDYVGSNKNIRMKGRKVYEFALRNVPNALKETLEDAKVPIDKLSKILLHQANAKMDHAMIERFYKLYDIPVPETIDPMTVQKLGNTSVSTIPIMYDLIEKKELGNHEFHKDDYLLFASVGASMNINSFVYKYKK
ncbi:3-oxoacyl-ACP synthase III family protein [Weeksella virosa]|uniref:3-oxoacyl-ACP synthase III family protein n=1 Tax=Weeksella virosa TaxID=1014 RepID=UPI000DFEE59D|nr:3-oxoacyl-ACP synthase III family protein [Weeksella virosa]MDK7675349.1 3-oxoacyl-ACP synthase III family protein [Weeksella virosa]SUP54814.1 3-oxoacyl-[acyl-carrier-protein] synthase 3 [Weeksella virosa]